MFELKLASISNSGSASGTPSAVHIKTPIEQVRALYEQWLVALSTRLDYAIEHLGSKTLRVAVIDAWLDLAEDHLVLRAELDNHPNRTGLRSQIERELLMLSLAAGVVSLTGRPMKFAEMGVPFMLFLRGHAATSYADPS